MKDKKTLNMIIEGYQKIEMQLLNSDGELTEDIENMLNINDSELGDKLNGYEKFIRYLKSQVSYLNEMEKHYSKKRKIIENSISRYKQSMAFAMDVVGKSKIKTEDFNFSLNESQKWSVDLEEIDEKLLDNLIDKGLVNKTFKANISEIKSEYKNEKTLPEWIDIKKNKFVKSI